VWDKFKHLVSLVMMSLNVNPENAFLGQVTTSHQRIFNQQKKRRTQSPPANYLENHDFSVSVENAEGTRGREEYVFLSSLVPSALST
jgi:hypothetical protein